MMSKTDGIPILQLTRRGAIWTDLGRELSRRFGPEEGDQTGKAQQAVAVGGQVLARHR